MADLEIVVDVRDNQTMSQYYVPRNGKVKFINAVPKSGQPDAESMLVIEAKKEIPWPFCTSNGDAKDNPIKVLPGEAAGAWICEEFIGKEVLYKATIGVATPEDPIIIFDRHKMNPDLAVAVAAGFVVGASAAALMLKWRGRKASPRVDVNQRTH